MYLITMAHLGEAQGTIDKFGLEKLRPDLYKNETMVLLITGEGPFEAATKTALTIPLFEIKEILNLGIAGTLIEELKVGDFVPVRSIYLINDQKPQFKSFSSLKTGLDCLTSFERILDKDKAQTLKGLGSIVDREAWGVAMAAKTASIPFRSYKMISDFAGTNNACELIKEKAYEFSLKLSEKIPSLLASETNQSKDLTLPGFYFTFTTSHRFKSIIGKLEIKLQKNQEEILSTIEIDKIISQEMNPKEKSKILLEKLEHLLDPTKKILQDAQKNLIEEFNQVGLRIQIDPNWENSKATISFEARNDLDIEEKINSLRKISLNEFSQLMNGELNVE
jgi:nucleoside phosphorylase